MSPSNQVIGSLQHKYGSANFDQWQSLRKQFYSFVQCPLAGASELTFFGDTISGVVNRQLTNMPKAGSFGQNHFIVKGIKCSYFIASKALTAWAGTDATTFATEVLSGVFQAGVLTFNVGSKTLMELPKPFLYAPPADGRPELVTAGVRTITLAEAAPNTLATFQSAAPTADLKGEFRHMYQVDPNILIEAEQSFNLQIKYPSGAIPVTATGVITAGNPLYVGIVLDGLIFRPLQ